MANRMSRTANLAVSEQLLREANELNIDVSQAAEAGIARAVEAETRARRWAEDNADVVRSTNDYIAKRGLPLRRYRVR